MEGEGADLSFLTTDALVVLCSVPLTVDADGLATELIQRSLAACVQLGPPLTSIYEWEGAMQRSSERLLFIKTRRELFESVAEAIRSVHPHEVPEIIGLPVSHGHAPYLAWINKATTRESRPGGPSSGRST